ncbi:MAG: FAD-dependent oxidoreductase [Kiritimatiellae bacterium]|nr:FAD-dependent oxidoreductase [Kiritimatiellia bacterium]
METELITLEIDGRSVSVPAGTTIFEAAKVAGIEIPNLCYLKELGPYGACGVCIVEVKDCPKMLRACSAKVAQGMVVYTNSEKALATRKLALELLMGDHDGDCLGPCKLNCPAHTDCQKYVKEIAEGRFADAVATIKETFPLPAAIGRVCPHPCEKACRRRLVEAPISIAQLKAFAADQVRKDGNEHPIKVAAPTGKKVGIIGGGPAGLTAAFKLVQWGHQVTVYDKMPEMGGMLRYGIPEYRLPKAILKAETDAIATLGVKFVNNFKIGRDVDFEKFRADFDAVIVANGAWKSTAMRVKGEELQGVWGGIDFLRAVVMGEKPDIGARVAIVGGGNTAMDACRTAVRVGAKEVFVVYRRTRKEMPAEDIEITEAEEEGVQFKFLYAPDEILGKDGKVCGMRLQVMELGEPDERGRRKPVPVAGKFEEIALDSVIAAIGQRNDPDGFEALPQTQKSTIAADEGNFATTISGVFACGDTVNKGAGIAIGAIAQANEAALAVDAFLRGAEHHPVQPVLSERNLTEKDFEDRPRIARAVMPQRPAEERRNDFKEVNLGLSPEVAQAEAKRCLECGCHDYFDCKLIRYANLVKADTQRLRGDFHPGFVEQKLVTIERNQRKCVLCNLCVRVCAEQAKQGLLGLVGRGFKSVIKPEFKDPAATAVCKDCRLCAENCPTGALRILG